MRYNPRTELFDVDRSTMAVFVDGGCLSNGYANARASFGVFFGPQSQFNSAAVLDRNAHRQTNQHAELFAVYKALRDIKYHLNHGNHSFISKEKAVIILDSRYVFECMTNWICRWRKNNFTDYCGGKVINARLICKMDNLMDELKYNGMHFSYGG